MRGMKKWLPFKSLDGQDEVIENMYRERNKVEKPVLSSDEEEEINECLVSLKKGDRVNLSYYEDGEIINRQAVFKSVQPEYARLNLDGFSLDFQMLLSISKIEE